MGRLAGTKLGTLVLRDLSVRQAAAFYEHLDRNRDLYVDFIPFVSKTHDVQSLRRTIERNLRRQRRGLAEFYTLWSRDKMAGYFLIREKDAQARWAEIGYMLDRDWQRQGITTRICTLLIEDLFNHEGFEKIVLVCTDDNTASIAVGRKLGFAIEGNLKRHVVVNGRIRNLLYMGLFRSEWTLQTRPST